MSFRMITALGVDFVLGAAILLIHIRHAHLTYKLRNGEGAVVPHQWVYAVLVGAMVAATAWWLLGRKTV